jgi:hypothetical protein
MSSVKLKVVSKRNGLLICIRPVCYLTINFTSIFSLSSVTCRNSCLYFVMCLVRALFIVPSGVGHTYGMIQLHGLRGIPKFISYKVNNMIPIVRPYLELSAVIVTACCARTSTERGGLTINCPSHSQSHFPNTVPRATWRTRNMLLAHSIHLYIFSVDCQQLEEESILETLLIIPFKKWYPL